MSIRKLVSPVIILVEPQLPENIGFSARAMFNFGITKLRLVNPQESWPNEKAISTSAGALESKKFHVTVHDDLEQAIDDVTYLFATTARKRDINKTSVSPIVAGKQIYNFGEKKKLCGVLFGGEQSGLKNNQLVKADKLINIKSNSEFSSINLAMSVLIVAYEYSIQKIGIKNFLEYSKLQEIAKKKELNFFTSRLINLLNEKNFFEPKEKKKNMIDNIESIFTRNNLSEQELKTLHGIISSLIKN